MYSYIVLLHGARLIHIMFNTPLLFITCRLRAEQEASSQHKVDKHHEHRDEEVDDVVEGIRQSDLHIYTCIYIYIYTYRERDVCICMYIYIYVCMYREREIERERYYIT